MIRWMVRWIVQWIIQTPIESGPRQYDAEVLGRTRKKYLAKGNIVLKMSRKGASVVGVLVFSHQGGEEHCR